MTEALIVRLGDEVPSEVLHEEYRAGVLLLAQEQAEAPPGKVIQLVTQTEVTNVETGDKLTDLVTYRAVTVTRHGQSIAYVRQAYVRKGHGLKIGQTIRLGSRRGRFRRTQEYMVTL
jgi:hypothetical protein